MRILYHHRTLADGAEGVHIREIQNALRAFGHEVHEISPVSERDPSVDAEVETRSRRQQRIDRWKSHLPKAAVQAAHIGYNLVTYRNVRRQLRRDTYDFMYSRYSCFGAGEMVAASACRVPVILEANVVYSGDWARQQCVRFPGVSARLERYVMAKAAGIVTVTKAIKEALIDRGVPDEKIIVSPNAVDPERIAAIQASAPRDMVRARLGLSGKIVIGFVGSFMNWHGIDLLCQAIPRVLTAVPEAHFLLVGSGEKLDDVRRTASDGGFDDRVRLTGSLPHDKTLEAVSAMDIAILPNANPWCCPMKVIEYMAFGCATVAPRLGNLLELVDDGVDGLLTTSGDCDELVDAIVMLARDPDRRNALGHSASAKILANHTWRHNAEEIVRLYRRVSESSQRCVKHRWAAANTVGSPSTSHH